MAPKRWRAVVESNLTAAYLALRQFAPGMAARGGGSIVIVGSAAGRTPGVANAAFSAANAGLGMLTRQAALELARRGVRVNMVAAGGVLTEQLEARVPEQRRNRLAAAIPLGRFGQPEDIGHAVSYLASDAAAWVTGVILDVTGGKVTG
jgi:3-oxoacyl-[acyl-carrier protein] reductase